MSDLSKSEQELVEGCFKMRADGQIVAEREDILAAIRASVGAAVEACAKHLEKDGGKDALEWAAELRTLYPAAIEELEKRLEAATEAALPLACKAIIESLGGGEFSPASPLAKVKAELSRRLSEARLEELDEMERHHTCPLTKAQPCQIHDLIAYRRLQLTAAAKETK